MPMEGKRVFHPAFYSELNDTEEWLELMVQQGWYPERLTLGMFWRFKRIEEPEWDKRWYIDVAASSQGIFGQEKLAALLPRLKKVFDTSEVAHRATQKRLHALSVKTMPNYRLEQFAVEEKQYRYHGSRIVQHMTPDRMLEIIKLKRSEALLTRCRTAFIVSLLLFVICCCLIVWQCGMGFYLLLTLPLWLFMLHYAIAFIRLSSELKKAKR